MKQRIYLSVDLDYWCAGLALWSGAIRTMQKLIKLGKPIIMVADHGTMIEHINSHPADCLINVDAHSDIWGYDSVRRIGNSVDCSNWVNAVSWQKGKEYIWFHPHKTGVWDEGFCHGEDPNPFRKKNRPKYAWKEAHYQRGFPTQKQIDAAIAVGIAISEDWLDNADQVEAAIRFALKHNIKLPDLYNLGRYEQNLNQKLLEKAKEKLS